MHCFTTGINELEINKDVNTRQRESPIIFIGNTRFHIKKISDEKYQAMLTRPGVLCQLQVFIIDSPKKKRKYCTE